MDENQIFAVIRKNILDILPELVNVDIKKDDSLRDLGANSVDRADILIQTMSDLNLKVPLVEFGNAKNIAGIIAVFSKNT